MEIAYTRVAVEAILRQLKEFVPKGERVHFELTIEGGVKAHFCAVQCFDEESPLPRQTVPLTL